MRHSTRLAISAVGAIALAGAFASPAFATVISPSDDTEATVTVAGGSLSITVPDSVDFGEVAPIQTNDPDSLASSQVALRGTAITDTRAGTEGWEVTYSVTPFVNTTTGEALPIDNFFVNPNTTDGVPNGVLTVQPGNPSTGATGTIYSAYNVHGNNDAAWTTYLTLKIPANALAGEYTGTFTQSITTAG
ncbi:hypothetical protein [Cryobacterium soli]|jgi:hypothetical protein|uniref:hypothetical protein n=1 Tax=Cryobacterium soli TaxID=2220095 RepID=UPI0013C44056|nr:hypothetical protein [Cryobacterium soli]